VTQPTYGENQPALANPIVVIPVRDAGERPFKFTGGAGSFFLMGLLAGYSPLPPSGSATRGRCACATAGAASTR
jgi:hypothetical protein